MLIQLLKFGTQMMLVPVALFRTSVNGVMIWCLMVPTMVILLMLLSVFYSRKIVALQVLIYLKVQELMFVVMDEGIWDLQLVLMNLLNILF